MKAKLISILLSIAVLVSLAACGGDPAGASNSGNDPTGSAEVSDPVGQQTAGTDANTFSFAANGTEITINENMADVLAAFGEEYKYQSYFEAESCAFDGLDKTYTYPGFVITTYPDGDQDFINSIRLTDDSITTREGAYVGCTADQVRTIYGDDAGDLISALSYTKGNTVLNFILDDGVVISIEYLPV